VESLDATGSFWFPGSEGVAVYGSLAFDPVDGTSLILTDGLSELLPNGEVREAWGGERDRVFGQIDHRGHRIKITLIDCIWLSQTKYYANLLLLHGHFAADDTNFRQAIIRLRDLPAWVAQEALTMGLDTALDEMERRELRVHLDRPPAVHSPFARGDLSLDFDWSRDNVDYEQLTIRQWPQFELTYTAHASLTEIMGDISSLQSLLVLCTDGPSAIDSVDLYRSDYPERLLSGDAIPDTMQKIELRSALIWSGSGEQQTRQGLHRMLVSFSDVGGMETAATWLGKAPSHRAIVGSLVSMRADSIFGENRLLNVCSAAEGFHRSAVGGSYMDEVEFKSIKRMLKKYLPRRHRKWFDTRMAHANDPSLNQRLNELADQLGTVADELVGDVPYGLVPYPGAATT
jgi:ApeA N-terminal domain 1